MSVGGICSRSVVTIAPQETIRVAAQRMADNDVGTLVVSTPNGILQAVGIVTDRDIVLRGIAGRYDLDNTPISKIMTTPVDWVYEGTPVEEAIHKMATTATRRLVVTGPGERLVGILSLDDILDQLVGEIQSVGELLRKQTPHVPV